MSEKMYIGDGVYAHHDGFQIVLTASGNGHENEIYLDDQVQWGLLRAMEKFNNVKIEVTANAKKEETYPR